MLIYLLTKMIIENNKVSISMVKILGYTSKAVSYTHLGYQTIYDENISGGQKQRIGLARAFLRKTPILLLDEPTSRIDSLNEAALLESLKRIKDEKLIIIVSHRKSSLALCDEIIEIEQGIIKT